MTAIFGTAATVIGIDVGGSKTRGIKWCGGLVQSDVTVGSANVQNVSAGEARGNLAHLFRGLGADGVDEVYAGAGGIDTSADAAALAAVIEPLAAGARVTVVHDTRLVLAAGGARTGVAVIAGTGSAAWGVNRDCDESRAGGWGYLLGDEGSGYWFGREIVRHSLHRMNLGLSPDAPTRALLSRCGLDQPSGLIAHFHGDTGRRYWAAMSAVVFDAAAEGHAGCLTMIDQAGTELASLAVQCSVTLDHPGPVVLGGGLGTNQPLLQNAFRVHLATHDVTDVRILNSDPVFGALELAASYQPAPIPTPERLYIDATRQGRRHDRCRDQGAAG